MGTGVFIELTEEQLAAATNNPGGSVPAPQPPSGGTVHDPVPWQELTQQPFGTRDAGSVYDLPGLYRGPLHMKLVVAGQLAFDATVPAGMSAGLHAQRVGDARSEWAGHPDIIAKIDALGLPDDAFAVFPHGNDVKALPFHAVEFKDGEHSQLTLTDQYGNQVTYKIANKVPQRMWVFTNLDGDKARNAFDA